MDTLSCTFYAKIDKPVAEVFDAVYNNDKLTGYFATGLASAPLDPGTTVQWAFHDFPEMPPFPVEVVETVMNEKIAFRWGRRGDDELNDVVITFEALDNPNQTLVRVTETGWPRTDDGISACAGNCGGWSNMLACLKVYLELGVNLRQFMF